MILSEDFWTIYNHAKEFFFVFTLMFFFLSGAEGKVDESIELMKEVEDLKTKKRMAEVLKKQLYPHLITVL